MITPEVKAMSFSRRVAPNVKENFIIQPDDENKN
jgi:hypothetical protein